MTEEPIDFAAAINGAGPAAADDSRAAPRSLAMTPSQIVDAWAREKTPLVRIPTGLPPLDEACRGGLPIPWRVVLVGAPSAGKTAVAMVIADTLARGLAAEGVAVGVLAVDEDPEDLTIRLLQMVGFTIAQAELRDAGDLAQMRAALEPLRLRLYDATWTIDAAAEDLAMHAAGAQQRATLLIDSIQAARSTSALEADTPRAVVEANMNAVRAASQKHRMLVIATSEANRASYRSEAATTDTNDLASGAESRSIEFGAQTLLILRTPKERPDTIHARIAKNRRGRPAEFWLQFDRDRHRLSGCASPDQDPRQRNERAERQRAANRAGVVRDAGTLLAIVGSHPGIGARDLRARVAGSGHKWGRERLEAATQRAADGVEGQRLVNRGARKGALWYVEGAPQHDQRSANE
jgi:KaiC/GvpD/RAD55 family RecA-like ATPase